MTMPTKNRTGRPRIDSVIKMEDARKLESILNSDMKALKKALRNHEILHRSIFAHVTNPKAKRYKPYAVA